MTLTTPSRIKETELSRGRAKLNTLPQFYLYSSTLSANFMVVKLAKRRKLSSPRVGQKETSRHTLSTHVAESEEAGLGAGRTGRQAGRQEFRAAGSVCGSVVGSLQGPWHVR